MKQTKPQWNGDLSKFKHGEEGTHYCCNSRLEKEGGKARCCECVPHEGCDYDKPSPEQWSEEFDKLIFVDDVEGGMYVRLHKGVASDPELIKDFIRSLIEKTRREALQKAIELVPEEKLAGSYLPDAQRTKHKGHNTCRNMMLKNIKKELNK